MSFQGWSSHCFNNPGTCMMSYHCIMKHPHCLFCHSSIMPSPSTVLLWCLTHCSIRNNDALIVSLLNGMHVLFYQQQCSPCINKATMALAFTLMSKMMKLSSLLYCQWEALYLPCLSLMTTMLCLFLGTEDNNVYIVLFFLTMLSPSIQMICTVFVIL